MAQGTISINKELCLGCGYCSHFCPKHCIVMSDKRNAQGFLTPDFAEPDDCNACGICGRMCPQYIIDVYKNGKGKAST